MGGRAFHYTGGYNAWAHHLLCGFCALLALILLDALRFMGAAARACRGGGMARGGWSGLDAASGKYHKHDGGGWSGEHPHVEAVVVVGRQRGLRQGTVVWVGETWRVRGS